MPRPGTLLLSGFILIGLLVFFYASGRWQLSKALPAVVKPPPHSLLSRYPEKTKSKAGEAKIFARQKGYNSATCFLIDMSLPSGQNRFFVYDMMGDSVKSSGLVAHGNCNQWWLQGRKYSNVVGCGCTSLGKYKVGYPYQGRFGTAYKLYGLDKTNDKAFQRYVVLHSYECVPESEVKDDICQSNGCPMVAVGFLEQLRPTIKKTEKPILLWIYE